MGIFFKYMHDEHQIYFTIPKIIFKEKNCGFHCLKYVCSYGEHFERDSFGLRLLQYIYFTQYKHFNGEGVSRSLSLFLPIYKFIYIYV